MKDKAPPVAEALQDAANFFISIDYPGGRGPGHLIEMARCCCGIQAYGLPMNSAAEARSQQFNTSTFSPKSLVQCGLAAGRCNGISGD